MRNRSFWVAIFVVAVFFADFSRAEVVGLAVSPAPPTNDIHSMIAFGKGKLLCMKTVPIKGDLYTFPKRYRFLIYNGANWKEIQPDLREYPGNLTIECMTAGDDCVWISVKSNIKQEVKRCLLRILSDGSSRISEATPVDKDFELKRLFNWSGHGLIGVEHRHFANKADIPLQDYEAHVRVHVRGLDGEWKTKVYQCDDVYINNNKAYWFTYETGSSQKQTQFSWRISSTPALTPNQLPQVHSARLPDGKNVAWVRDVSETHVLVTCQSGTEVDFDFSEYCIGLDDKEANNIVYPNGYFAHDLSLVNSNELLVSFNKWNGASYEVWLGTYDLKKSNAKTKLKLNRVHRSKPTEYSPETIQHLRYLGKDVYYWAETGGAF